MYINSRKSKARISKNSNPTTNEGYIARAEIDKTESPDSELVESVLLGSEEAFQILVQRHLTAVYTFCVRYMGNAEDAQDAAQETFLKAWKNLNRFDTSKPFRTWLFAIAKNSATDLMRKRKSVVFSKFDSDDESNVLTDTLADSEPLPDEIFASSENAEIVKSAMKGLKPREQIILTLHYEEGLTFEEIALTLDLSPNTVRSLHRRALIHLRSSLARHAPNT